MHFTNKEDRREKYKSRKCYWCKNSIKNCNLECQCIFCIFDNKFDYWKKGYPNSNKWFKKNLRFYEKLFKKGLARETKLAQKWQHHQVDVVEKTGTNIQDWSADFKVIHGERKIIPNYPGNYKIITPYYDYVKQKSKFRHKYHCQICGQDIVERYFIKHKGRKICIGIGIDCAIIFHYSDELTKRIKHDMDIIIKKEFKKMRPILKKAIKQKLQTRTKNKKWLRQSLNTIKNYGRKNTHPIAPEKITQLLLELDKAGIDIFAKKILESDEISPSPPSEQSQKSIETSSIKADTDEENETEKNPIPFEKIRDVILTTMKNMGGVYEDAVHEDQIMIELQKLGMTEHEISENIQRMLQRNHIFEFIPHKFKIKK